MWQLSRRKKVPSTGKESRDNFHSHYWEFYKNTNLHNRKVYTENLAQTYEVYMFADSFSTSPYELCLADSVARVLDSSASYNPSSLLSVGLP